MLISPLILSEHSLELCCSFLRLNKSPIKWALFIGLPVSLPPSFLCTLILPLLWASVVLILISLILVDLNALIDFVLPPPFRVDQRIERARAWFSLLKIHFIVHSIGWTRSIPLEVGHCRGSPTSCRLHFGRLPLIIRPWWRCGTWDWDWHTWRAFWILNLLINISSSSL
jgi:hypothetical protein